MPVIGMFSSVFCKAEHVADQVQSSTGLKALSDEDVVSAAHNLSGIAVDKIRRVFWAKTSLFNYPAESRSKKWSSFGSP